MWNYSYNYFNYTEMFNYRPQEVFIDHVLTCIILSVSLPLTLVAIYSLVQEDQVAPIYMINLLISDLIQFLYMILKVVKSSDIYGIFSFLYLTGVMASVYFMVCIAMERYLLIAWPVWYRHRRTVKISVLVCVAIWTLTVACNLFVYFSNYGLSVLWFLLLLPLLLLIFFLAGTIRALSAAISLPIQEKMRIVGLLVLVLLIYTLLFLPIAIFFHERHSLPPVIMVVSIFLVKLSPLADLIMYFFLRKGAVNKLLASVCCRMGSSDSCRSCE